MSETVVSGSAKDIWSKLSNLVEEGNCYEAHQKYKAVYFRFSKSKRYEELKTILYDGALLLLLKDQEISGIDVADLFITTLVESKTEPSPNIFKQIAMLFTHMKSDLIDRTKFLKNALQWSSNGKSKIGHSDLHRLIAECYWKRNDYKLARYHYLHSTDGSGYARMLVQLHMSRGYEPEIDLFIAQVVLQYLCLKKKSTANDVFEVYIKLHPNISGPPFILPLLNFLCFLLKTVDSGKLTTFIVLCEKYQAALKRDPTYPEYLEKIAQIFFNVRPLSESNQNDIFGSMIQSFLVEPTNRCSNTEDDIDDSLFPTPY